MTATFQSGDRVKVTSKCATSSIRNRGVMPGCVGAVRSVSSASVRFDGLDFDLIILTRDLRREEVS